MLDVTAQWCSADQELSVTDTEITVYKRRSGGRKVAGAADAAAYAQVSGPGGYLPGSQAEGLRPDNSLVL